LQLKPKQVLNQNQDDQDQLKDQLLQRKELQDSKEQKKFTVNPK